MSPAGLLRGSSVDLPRILRGAGKMNPVPNAELMRTRLMSSHEHPTNENSSKSRLMRTRLMGTRHMRSRITRIRVMTTRSMGACLMRAHLKSAPPMGVSHEDCSHEDLNVGSPGMPRVDGLRNISLLSRASRGIYAMGSTFHYISITLNYIGFTQSLCRNEFEAAMQEQICKLVRRLIKPRIDTHLRQMHVRYSL